MGIEPHFSTLPLCPKGAAAGFIIAAGVKLLVLCRFCVAVVSVAVHMAVACILMLNHSAGPIAMRYPVEILKGFTMRFLLNVATGLVAMVMDMAMSIPMATRAMMMVIVQTSATRAPASLYSWSLGCLWTRCSATMEALILCLTWGHQEARCHAQSATGLQPASGTVMWCSPCGATIEMKDGPAARKLPRCRFSSS